MRIDDGFSTTVSFALLPTVKFWEKEVTPPSMSGGGANEVTTMRNQNWRTNQPKKLISYDQMTFSAAYDPMIYNDCLTMLNRNQKVIIKFPDGTTTEMWGWIDTVAPGALSEGSQPTIDVTVIASNMDDQKREAGPVTTAGVAPVYSFNGIANGPTSITLNWDASDTVGATYKIQRRLDTATEWNDVEAPAAGEVTYEDTQVTAGKVYAYQIQAIKGTKQSDWRSCQIETPAA